METQHRFKQWTPGLVVLSMAWIMGVSSASGQTRTYTLDAEFSEGTLINLSQVPADQLQLDDTQNPFNFIWIAVSTKGTIVKVDTNTGAVLGEYRSAPSGLATNPSRTTVDGNGNVWAGNRDESSHVGGVRRGSIVHIGLEENGQCVDRNGNGVIDTSTGLNDIKAWPNITDGVGSHDGALHIARVQDAADECIIHYQRTTDTNIRHVSVDGNNNVWTAGNFTFARNIFDLVDGTSGGILATTVDLPCGGYGGLVDGNGVLWSANRGPGGVSLLRYDTKNTNTTADDTFSCLFSPNSYGLGIDSSGNVWNSEWTSDSIRKFSPAGGLFGGFPKGTGGASNDRGVAVTSDDHVWVANSGGNNVSRLDNNGFFLAAITTGPPSGFGPTGVAVDANGNVWATHFSARRAYRINPTLGAFGAVDLFTPDLGGNLYNYSDMTGSTLTGAPDNGTWTIIHDCGVVDFEWGTVTWNAAEPGDSSITVTAASSDDGVIFGPAETVTNGVDLTVANGQFLKVVVSFTRATNIDSDGNGVNDSPILFDLTIECCEPVEDPDVRTQGFWKRVCKKPHPSGEHEKLPDYVDCVSASEAFANVGNVDDLCDRLHPNPQNDKCEQAEAQFMALLLNVCSGRVATCNCIDDPDLGETTVGEAAEFIDDLLSNPDRTFQDCVLAQAIADSINNGETLVECP